MRQFKINISQAVEQLEQMLGKEWLENNIKIMKDGQGGKGGFGRSIDFDALGVSPLAGIWYKAREEMIDIEICGGGMPGPFALHVAVLGTYLCFLRDSEGITERVEVLKEAKDLTPNVNEMCIAAGYARRGYRIFFNPECGRFEIKGSCFDAEVSCAKLSVEQSLTDYEKMPQRRAKRILHLIGETGEETLYSNGFSTVLMKDAETYDLTTLICMIGLQNIKNRPAFIQKGRLVYLSNDFNENDIYVPGEILVS